MRHQVNDKFNRPLRDLRISVTDRCNFRCSYCMPEEIFGPDYKFLQQEKMLSFGEIEKLAKIFANLGVEKIRITGGEPLLRKDLPQLIEKLRNINGIKFLALTTNGVLLPKYAKSLKEAGLQRVNISLDSLNDDLFKKINGRGVGVNAVLKGIDAAEEAGLEVKVNMVVKKGLNDHDIMPMVTYFRDRRITLRFIEFMDVGSTNGWNYSQVISKKEIYEMIKEQYSIEPADNFYYGEVAKRYRYTGTNTEVGFISSVTESFCGSCTRARLSVDGKLYACLFATKGFDLKTLLRSDVDLETIKQSIVSVWNKRDDRYSEIRTEESASQRKKIEMSYIGG